MSATRKAKRGANKKPELSSLDQAVYVLFAFLGFTAGMVFLWFFGRSLPESIAFSDSDVVALNNITALICALPAVLFLIMVPTILVSYGTRAKQPIFGNKHIKQSILKPKLQAFPLFSKEFRANMSDNSKRRIKRTSVILLVLFAVCVAVLPLGACPRTVLDKNNNCSTYNVFNQKTHTCNIKDADKLIIDIHRSGGKSGPSWKIQLIFVFADEIYIFDFFNFRKMTDEETLRYMLYLKGLFGNGRYEITNIDQMERLINDRDYNALETELVYELFEYEGKTGK